MDGAYPRKHHTNPAMTKVKPMTLQTPVQFAFSNPNGALNLRTAGRSHGSRLAAILAGWMERDARHRALCRLQSLDEHMLRDIGLTRDDVRGRRV